MFNIPSSLGGSVLKNHYNVRAKCGFDPWVRKIPGGKWQLVQTLHSGPWTEKPGGPSLEGPESDMTEAT